MYCTYIMYVLSLIVGVFFGLYIGSRKSHIIKIHCLLATWRLASCFMLELYLRGLWLFTGVSVDCYC